jgi:hypothetical protein
VVEDALHAIGQTMASMGAMDKQLIGMSLDYHLNQQIAGYWCADPAPTCVTPASLHLIDYGYEVARLSGATLLLTTMDMAYIGFFYLNHPGEYSEPTFPDSLSAPFAFVMSSCPSAAVFLMQLLLPSMTSSMLHLLVTFSRIRKMQCKGKKLVMPAPVMLMCAQSLL